MTAQPERPDLSLAGQRALDEAAKQRRIGGTPEAGQLRDTLAKLTAVSDRTTETATGPVDQHHGQLRFAERFTRKHGDLFIHVHGIGWHRYDGIRWVECTDGAETRAMTSIVKAAYSELPHLGNEDEKALLVDIRKVESAAGVDGALALAGRLHPCTVAATALDGDAYLLNTATGTVNLHAAAHRPGDPGDHLSKATTAGFNPDARADIFDQFLATIQPAAGMRAFLARSLGSALLGQVRDHVLLIWHGTGANGKGTLRDAVRHALGSYAIEVPADILLQQKYGQQALAPERMRLKAARLAFCSEIANGAHLDEATMKKLTGGDPVNAKLLYRNPVEFDPSHTLVMLTNHLPVVRGDDPAVWRRILAVPFTQVVPAEKQDAELPEKLKACPDAVLAWLWGGWLDYQENGLNPPAVVTDATRKYKLDSDVLARFLADESVVVQGHGSVSSSTLYKAFKDWSRAQGEETDLSNRAFTDALQLRGYERQRDRNGASWMALMLAAPDHQGDQL